MKVRLLGVVVLLASLKRDGVAQAVPTIPLEVETVASGGYWSTKDRVEGHYRIVISTGGSEHLISTLWVQWVTDPTDPDSLAHVVASKEVTIGPAAAGVHLTNPRLSLEAGHWVLLVDATNTHCDPMPIDRWRIGLESPSSVKALGSVVVKRGCS